MKRSPTLLPASLSCAVYASLTLASADARGANPPPDPTVDPCTLLTKAEVEQAIGKLKAAPKSGRNDRLLTCDYQFADEKNELLVWVMPATAMERARKEFKDLVPVKGLGEEAVTHHDERFDYTVLYFKKGNAVVEIGVPAAAKNGAATVKALAVKAAGRLPAK